MPNKQPQSATCARRPPVDPRVVILDRAARLRPLDQNGCLFRTARTLQPYRQCYLCGIQRECVAGAAGDAAAVYFALPGPRRAACPQMKAYA